MVIMLMIIRTMLRIVIMIARIIIIILVMILIVIMVVNLTYAPLLIIHCFIYIQMLQNFLL